MIPAGVNLSNLTDQLAQDGVAFSDPTLAADHSLQETVDAALAPNHGIAVVDFQPVHASDARDIAQELKDASGLDTVIVQAPGEVAVVSDSYSRGQIESAQQAIPAGIDQVAVLHDFYAGIDQAHFPWMLTLAAFLIVGTVFFLVAFRGAVSRGLGYSLSERALLSSRREIGGAV